MSSEWPVYTVQQLVDNEVLAKPKDGNHGSIHPKSSDYVDSGVPFIMATDMLENGVDFKNCKYITEEMAASLRKGFAEPGDVLLSHKATIGRTSILQDYSYSTVVLTPQVTYYRVLNEEELNNKYLHYYFKSEGFQNLFNSWAGGGSTRAYLGITDQRKLPITVPPIGVQKDIARILGDLDQKIHLNQQTNETLEAMAQAIFKSWFVDFDPVRAKIEAKSAGRDPSRAAMATISGISLEQEWDEVEATLDQKLARMSEARQQQLTQTAQLFPDELVESEIGEVPKGWWVKTAEEILKRFRAPKRVKKDEVEETGKVVVLEQGEGIIMGYHNQEAGYDASPNNPYFIFGDHTCITHLVIEPFDIAPNVIPLQGEDFDSYWTYYAIRDLQQFQEYRRHWSELKVKEVVTPNNELDELFAEFIKPLIIKINKNRNENLTLSQLRDKLLPKLISGEIKIDN